MANIIDPNDLLRIRRSEDDEKKKAASKRAEAEPVSPSKQGQFLSALERQDRPTKKEDEGKEVPQGLFQAIQPKEDKGSEAGEEEFGGETSEKPSVPPQRPMEVPKPLVTSSPMFEAAPRHVAPTEPRLPRKTDVSKPKAEKEKAPVKKEEIAQKGASPVHPPIVGLAELRRAGPSIEEPKDTRTHLQALVKECVSAIQTLVSKGETTSVVTLKYPPLFEGSTLTVTEFATARKEFNITFANLSPDARRLIEVGANQEQLRQSLVEKGYALHMVTIEAPPKPIAAAATETQAETGGKRGGAQGQKEGETQADF